MYDALIAAAASKYSVPESWIKAVIETESSWNPRAYRAEPQIEDASYGLMQLLSSTANGLGFDGPVSDLYKPEVSIEYGAKLLSQLIRSFGDDFRDVYSAYNSGDPGMWERSSEVYNNVFRAVTALEKYGGSSPDDYPWEGPVLPEEPAEGDWTWSIAPLLLLFGGALLLFGGAFRR